MGKGSYRGGSTLIGPKSGWFSFGGTRRGRPIRKLLSEKEYREGLRLAELNKDPEREAKEREIVRLGRAGTPNGDGSSLIKRSDIETADANRQERVQTFARASAKRHARNGLFKKPKKKRTKK